MGKGKMWNAENQQRVKCGKSGAENICGMKRKMWNGKMQNAIMQFTGNQELQHRK